MRGPFPLPTETRPDCLKTAFAPFSRAGRLLEAEGGSEPGRPDPNSHQREQCRWCGS